MRSILRRRPSPALVVAMIALFASLSGSAYAIHITGAQIRDRTITYRDVARDGLGGTNIKESRLGEVPLATNSANLGGVPPAGYQRSCTAGTVQGFVRVRGSTTFGNVYTSDPAKIDVKFNCTGGEVEVRRVAAGDYRVKFNSNPASLGVGNSFNDFDNFVAVGRVTDVTGEEVFRVVSRDDAGNTQDRTFALAIF